MQVSINKSVIKGGVSAPPSKSYTIRGLMCAALAKGKSKIVNPLKSDDTDAAVNVLRKIGAGIIKRKDVWHVSGGNLHPSDSDLFCGDSAATLRFMTAICSTIPGKHRLTAGPSLSRRPVRPLVDALQQLGVKVDCEGDLPPVTVEGGELREPLVNLPGNISSQFVSALLLAVPLSYYGVTIELTTRLESKSYVEMTLECLGKFGVEVGFATDLCEFAIKAQNYIPTEYHVEGDWSSASYLLALGALSGEVAVANLNVKSYQGDRVILDFLRQMGAEIAIEGGSVIVRKQKLQALEADLTDCIDLLPTMAVLASLAEGTSVFTGIQRARLKESDRVSAVKEGLERIGVKVMVEQNCMTIVGSNPGSAVIDSKGDHRIAMAFSVLGSVVGGITIDGAECVSKTYPDYWDVLKSIGGEVKINGK